METTGRYTQITLNAAAILILTAVQIETRAIRHALGHTAVRVVTSGIRAIHMPSSAQLTGVSLIIACGIAGALDPALKLGDVILDDPDHRLPDSPLYRRGRIHTASQIIATPDQKAQLFSQTGRAAVDMEQQLISDFAARLQIPVIGLRAISDTARQVLDPAVVHLVDELGRPRPIKIAATLIRRPGFVRYLSRLNSDTKFALKNLCLATRHVVDQLLVD